LDYAVFNNKINELARELVTLDIERDAGRIKTIRNKILSDMFTSLTENKYRKIDDYGNELYYYPLIRQYIYVDVFMDAILELLKYNKEKGCWAYKSEKGSFISAFKFLLNMRMKSFMEKLRSNEKKPSLDDKIGDEEDMSLIDTIAGSDNVEEEVVRKSLSVGKVLCEYEKMAKKQSQEHKNEDIYLRTFFTFYTAEAVKTDSFVADVACKYNDSIFPYMDIKLFEYLMVGNFRTMLDVIQNKLRDTINLKQRQKIISHYTGVSRETIVEHNKRYNKLVRELLGSEGLQGYKGKQR